ncbi:TPA: alpha-D-ribose 1-methylphosphonate 5-triphosphate diphosphatase [Escherichia coli]
MINVQNVSKTFILHQQNGVHLPVLNRASLTVNAGECVVLHGHSGSGKSTLLRSLYANYLPDEGQIQIKHGEEWVDLVTAPARKVVEIRKTTIGWVSQFLRVIPRISALEVVMQPLLDTGVPREACAAKAARLLTRLNVPERLWHLAPSTFSGGEQQRVNIARGFIVDYPILLLDEPTASLDAVAIGDVRDGGDRLENLEKMINAIEETQKRGVNRAEHRLHLRCELPHHTTLPLFEKLVQREPVTLVSLMDHSPGQRQFANREKYREYYQGKYSLTDAQMQQYEEEQLALAARWSQPNRESIAALCRARQIALASHDDATHAHVAESHQLGSVIAEFPTTFEAAEASRRHGMNVLMGAPNIVRGGSHSGNVAASELAQLGLLDILSSDYYPASLLDAAFRVADDESNRFTLPQAVKLVTKNPAQALNLQDRGVIGEGKRADLVLAHRKGNHIHIDHVWRQGKRVF